ncbi:nucleoside diphosphate kinase homolog 5-like [Danaus plexippus]|uniref:Non-metastatic cells 5 protein expressed in n=1 Tax=Danaus plexippus plexippus TaxID=278856 RepID=A0A212EYE5_DANPL|nr:nucleoside diphosphate kinase homolog 5-like [Danaus plexippus]XP_032515386.1 nucleoside diphosphate kinase homolog 5-like [Danaus plexippus plexippus]OWR46516.1 non-metastatic cells 5 protein expressed in [Danaus plexippus plexippus]
MSVASSDSGAEYHTFSERTLAIIKPEAFDDADAIEDHIVDNGFMILARRKVKLTPEQAAELYRGHYGRHHFPHLVAHMSSGPIIALVLAAQNCIHKWRVLMGPARVVEAQAYWPDSLRACYGRRTKYGDYFNALHGSENYGEAIREIHFFFPEMIVGPLLRQWQVGDYILKYISPTLAPALTTLAHDRPAEPLLWLADYLRRHNPNQPELAPQPTDMREERKCQTPTPSEVTPDK